MIARSPMSLPSLAAICLLFSSLSPTASYGQTGAGQPSPAKPGLPPPKSGAAGAAPAASPAVRKASDLWQTAIRYQKANKLPAAIAAYEGFLKAVKEAGLPASTETAAYQNLTGIYRSQGKTAEMLASMKHWAALAPQNAPLHAELASLYASQNVKQFDEAIKEAHRALALKPAPSIAATAHSSLGIAAVSKRDYVTAEQEFGAAVKLVPANYQMQFNYGLALVERKKLAPALAAMQRAAALNPKMPGAWYYVGLLNESEQNFGESIKAYKRAVHLAPKDPTIRFDLARVQVRSNDLEGAVASYLVALEFAPQSLPTRLAVAQVYVQMHNYSAARVQYADAAKMAPKNAVILAGLADCETQLSTQPQDLAARAALLKQAEEHYRAAADLDPRYLTGPNSLTQFYERTGEFAKAQQVYRKRMAAAPDDFTNVNWLAETYIMQRKPDDAIAIWRKYRDAHPDNSLPYMHVADTLEAEAKWDDAIAEWKLLLKQKINSGETSSVLVSIGKDLARAGRNKEATDQLEAVLKLDPAGNDAPAAIRVAVAATLQAERLEAMQQLAQIAERSDKVDEAIRWQQQIKAEEAAVSERTHRSTDIATYLALARLYQQAKKPEMAIKELEAATQTRQSKPESLAPAYDELARVYESVKRYDDAVLAYRRAARLSREPMAGLLHAAEVYQRSNRLALAISEFEAIRKEFPKDSRVLGPLALAYRQAGRDEDAIRVYDELVQTDPRAGWARDQKAAVLTHMRRFDDARALYEDQLAQSPQNRQLYADVAFVFQAEGKPDAFLDWAVPRLAKAPANGTLMSVIVDEAIRQKKEEYGWTLLRDSAAKHKAQRAVLEATAAVMEQRGRKDDAVALYRQIASQYPNDLTAQAALADGLFAAGRKDEAAKVYTGMIERPDIGQSQKLSVRRQFARTCVEQGNPAEAVVQLQEIVKADPADFDSAARLALLLEAAGRVTDAMPILENLANHEGYDAAVRAQVRSKLGSLYLKTGDKTQAAAQFKKALELNPKDKAAQAGLAQLAGGPK